MGATARRASPCAAVAKLRSLLSLGKRRQPRPGVELKARSVELVRTTPGDVVDDASRVASILRAEVVGDHLDLLQRVLVGEVDLRPGDQKIVVRLPIQL